MSEIVVGQMVRFYVDTSNSQQQQQQLQQRVSEKAIVGCINDEVKHSSSSTTDSSKDAKENGKIVELIVDHDGSDVVVPMNMVFPIFPFENKEKNEKGQFIVDDKTSAKWIECANQLASVGDYRSARNYLLLSAVAKAQIPLWPPEIKLKSKQAKKKNDKDDDIDLDDIDDDDFMVLVMKSSTAISLASSSASASSSNAPTRDEVISVSMLSDEAQRASPSRIRPLNISPTLCCDMARYALKTFPPDCATAIDDCTFALEVIKLLEVKKASLSEDEKKSKFNAYYLRSHAYVLQSHFSLAAEDIKKAVLLDPKDVKARQVSFSYFYCKSI